MQVFNVSDFINMEENLEGTIKKICLLESLLIKQNKKGVLNHLIDDLNFNAKLKLFEPCIGQNANDEGKYNMGYTEWDLLKSATFIRRSDGRISIQLENNAGYNANYALGKPNHAKMQAEFEHLLNIMGLKFSEDTDFHKELIFTQESSRKLIKNRLHHNCSYLKTLLSTKNTAALFNQAKKYSTDGDEKNPKLSVLYSLPKGVLEKIRTYAYADQENQLDPDELSSTIALAWDR